VPFFTVIKKSKKSRARLGILHLTHGKVETPAFVPVATQAVVKTLAAEEARKSGAQLLIANTYHLHLKPGEKFVKKRGGLHRFMAWDRPLMTDSGGFQVFSLGFGRDHGVGKILSKKVGERVRQGAQPQKIQITGRGVWFRSIVDGKKLFIGPKESMRIQSDLGADIIFAFDECTSPVADKEYTKNSLVRSHQWAQESLRYRNKKQKIYGIVQGGKYQDLRKESAQFISGLAFDGYGIGGEFGDNKSEMTTMINWVVDELPNEKPRHLLGIGHPEDIESIIRSGIDTFDCIAPTHYARRGIAFTSRGRLSLSKKSFLTDAKPIDTSCKCTVCKTYTRAYICHLMRASEITALSLITMHNLFYFNSYVALVRQKIKKGAL